MTNSRFTLSLDEKGHAMDSLSRSLVFLSQTDQNPYNWKWFVIAFHNALYSFMLLALKNTDSSGIWEIEKKHEKGFIDVFEGKLISFLKAFKWIQEPERMSGYVNAKPYSHPKIEKIKTSMEDLNNKLRNQFAHFKPMLWAGTPDYFADTCYPLINIVEFLTLKSGRISFIEKEVKIIQAHLSSLRCLLELYIIHPE